jgi:hypothetical protein
VRRGGAAPKEYGIGLLKGIIGALPYVGTLVNEALFDARSRLKQERLNAFFVGVAESVEKLGQESIDHAYLKTEEFSDLVEDICLRVTRTRSEQRRQHLRKQLLDAFQGRRQPDLGPLFLGMLEQISEDELNVLRTFVSFDKGRQEREREGRKVDMGPIDYDSKPWGLDESAAKQVLSALISKGLAADNSQAYYDSKPLDRVLPTALGVAFYTWLME